MLKNNFILFIVKIVKMSGIKKMLLRVQSSEGTKRVEIGDTEATCTLYEAVHTAFNLNNYAFALYRDRNKKDEIISNKTKRLSECGLRHGDMLYMTPINGAVIFNAEEASTSAQQSPKPTTKVLEPVKVESILSPRCLPDSPNEDDVDTELFLVDGKIQRKRDDKLCRHNSNGCCVHCSPLEPYDESHLKEQNVRHMSFHAHIRKHNSTLGGRFLYLENISCKIKPGCKEHPPWPRGICSACQPSALTLNRQQYRHVDNVMFENPEIVDRFLGYWRATGHQRVGYMFGKYERHTDVPLGIRARVVAIYEPPQTSTRDSVTILPDEHQQIIEEIVGTVSLVKVGWIFTDLLTEDSSKGTVQQLRGIDSHFLSAQECMMAGHLQNEYRNRCRYSSTGYYGSKFVTVCVTGDSSKQIHLEGYQVSEQCQALVRDHCLLPTKDAPELAWVRESSEKQYVPDVYYKEKDQYGNEVQRIGRPLPVEYLLVDVPAAVARVPLQTFSRTDTFPSVTHHQNLRALAQRLRSAPLNTPEAFLEVISDFHLLIYLATNSALPFPLKTLEPLLCAVRSGDATGAATWRDTTEEWATLEQLVAAAEDHHMDTESSAMSGGVGGGAGGPEGASGGASWTCPHCTFDNAAHRTACEICVLPRTNSM